MTVKLFNHHLSITLLLLAICEAAVLMLATGVGVISADSTKWLPASLILSGFIFAAMLSLGLYQSTSAPQGFSGTIQRFVFSCFFAVICMAIFLQVFPFENISIASITIAGGLACICLCLVRFGLLKLFSRNNSSLKRRILVLGAGERARNMFANDKHAHEFALCGYLSYDDQDPLVSNAPVIQLGEGTELSDIVAQYKITEIVEAMDDRRQSLPVEDLMVCKSNGVKVSNLVEFCERISNAVNIQQLHPSNIIFSDAFLPRRFSNVFKRLFDLTFSLIMLLLLWPFMLLAALAIMIESGFGQPIFYSQKRVGQHGKVFSILKFRSMRTDAEKFGAVWAQENDPRITRVGAFMRKTRIDELPQLFNVLNGTMSLVGPRPERPEFDKGLIERIPFYKQRYLFKPGIAGWAQLRYPYGANEADSIQKLQYDLYYIKNHTVLFDFLILIQTVEIVLFGKGAR